MNLKHGLSRTAAYKTEHARKWRATHPEQIAKWRPLIAAINRERRAKFRAAGLCIVCGKEPLVSVSMGAVCLEKKRAARRTPKGIAQRLAYRKTERQKIYDQKYKKIAQLKIKNLVFGAYGGGRCKCCGESALEFLSIDHIVGWRNMPVAPRGGTGLYRWLRRNNFPPGFQVLCFNCNFAKGHFGGCPHQKGGGI